MKFHFRSYDHHSGGGMGGVVVPTDHPSALLVIDAHGRNAASAGRSDFRTADYGGEHRQGHGHGDEPYGVASHPLDVSLHKGECHHPPSANGSQASSAAGASVGLTDAASSVARRHFAAELTMATATPAPGSPMITSPAAKTKRALHLEDSDHEDEDRSSDDACQCQSSRCPADGGTPDPHSRPRSRQFFRLGRHRSRGKDQPICSGGNSSSSEDELCSDDSKKRLARSRRRSGGIAGLRKMRRSNSLPTDISKAKSVADVRGRGGRQDGNNDNDGEDRLSHSDRTSRTSRRGKRVDRLSSSERPRSSNANPSPRTHRRHVTFSSVQIREYSTILGDHPCCPSGPPLSLGWTLEREDSMEFEKYERVRAPCRARCKDEMRLGGDVRRDILQSLVVTSSSSSGSLTSLGSSDHDDSCDPGEERCPSATDGSGDTGDGAETTTTTAMYSSRELRRAERKLTRERAGLNSRAHRRMNRKFFSQMTPGECEIGIVAEADVVVADGNGNATDDADPAAATEAMACSPMNESESENIGDGSIINSMLESGGGCSLMDISPIKSPTAVTGMVEEDNDAPSL